jgi:hypothetical protein
MASTRAQRSVAGPSGSPKIRRRSRPRRYAFRDALGDVHPVEQGQHQGLRPEQRLHGLQCGVQVVGLGREQHQVDRLHRGGLLCGLHGMHGEALQLPQHGEALIAQRIQVRAAGDEGDVLAGAGQHPAVVRADAACAHHGDAQALCSAWASRHAAPRPPARSLSAA